MIMRYKENAEFPMDAKSDGVLIMPVNLQGLLEFGTINRRFKHEFPIISKLYLKDCINGVVCVGDIKEYTENDKKVILCFYKEHELNGAAETDLKLEMNMVQCLSKLFNKYSNTSTKFYSPVIPYKQCQMKIAHHIKDHEWVVLREDVT